MAMETSYSPVNQDRKGMDSSSPETHLSPRRPAKRRGCWTRWTDDGWLLEIASTVLGILFIIALVVILRNHDGKPAAPVSGFGTSLSLNTITAILSTTAKAALLYPVGTCISQLKWIWFSRGSRRLHDMTVFDSASRGIVGGFELIWMTRLGTFAALGSLIMIYAIAIDPLSQQLVTYYSDSVLTSGTASVQITDQWMDTNLGDNGISITGPTLNGFGYPGVSTGMKGAIQSALYLSNETIEEIAPDCPSLNCTFPSYSSLAVCTSFADVTSHLVKVDVTPDPRATKQIVNAVSNSSYILQGWGKFNVSSAAFDDSKRGSRDEVEPFLIFNNSIAFKDVEVPLADVFVLYAKDDIGDQVQYGALEFIMEWCVQDFTTTVVDGVSYTRLGESLRNFTNPTDHPLKHVGDDVYEVLPWAHFSTSRYLDYVLRGAVQQGTDQQFYASTDVGTALYEPYNVWAMHDSDIDYSKSKLSTGITGTNQTGLEHIINNVATSMTNFIRRNNNQFTTGIMYRDELLVHIRWKWIAAHVAFIGLCALLLVTTMIATHLSALRSAGAWKSSSSAVLHALSPTLQQEGGGISTLSEGKAYDRGLRVRLCNMGDEGWRLVAGEEK